MSQDDELTGRLRARMAYRGIRTRTPTADLLPTGAMPFCLTFPDCRARGRVPGGPGPRDVCAMPAGTPGGRDPAPGLVRPSSAARWDGGHDWSGRYEAPVSARIAGALLERGLDVEDGVRSLFRRVTTTGSPYPNQLLSAEALDAYEREEMPGIIRQRHVNRRVMDQRLALEIRHEMSMYGHAQLEAAGLAVFRKPTNALQPFFRYWVVAQLDPENPEYRAILEAYRRPALLTYAASVRAYDEAYDHPALGSFRTVVEMTRRGLEDLVAGDQGGWGAAPDATAGSLD